MGMISRYFERLARVRSRRTEAVAVTADAEGIRVGDERAKWSDIQRLDIYKRDIYAGHLLCLAIVVDEDRVFEINEESPGWSEAGVAIEEFLPGSLPRAEWTLRLIAAGAGDSMTIYRASGSGSVG